MFVIGFSRHSDWCAHIAVNAREGFRNNQGIPTVEDPGSLYRNIEAEDRRAGHARQMNRSWFSNVARAARAVDSEGDKLANLKFALQLTERLQGSARA